MLGFELNLNSHGYMYGRSHLNRSNVNFSWYFHQIHFVGVWCFFGISVLFVNIQSLVSHTRFFPMASYQGQVPGFESQLYNIEERPTSHQSEPPNAPNLIQQESLSRVESAYYRPSIPHSHVYTEGHRKRSRVNSDAVPNDSLREVISLLSHASLHDIELILSILKGKQSLSWSL